MTSTQSRAMSAPSRTVPRHRAASPQVPPTAPPPPSTPLAARRTRLTGHWRYDRATGEWWWSPEMSTLHGLPADGSGAGTEALLTAQHPDDRARTIDALSAAVTGAEAFCIEARVRTGNGGHRTVVLIGEPRLDGDGRVVAVEGLAVQSPRPAGGEERVRVLEAEVAQLRTAMATRAPIEQAKGVLMLLTGCGDQVAFDLLAHISSHTHRKVRDVAVCIIESASGRSALPEDVRSILHDACPPSRSTV